jgi:serine/threonine protein kinase/tetratricopeptide (TPR) repeat protein
MAGEGERPGTSGVEAVFATARALPQSEWAAYLDKACGDNQRLRQRVEALLSAHEAPDGFLPEQPGSSPPDAGLAPSIFGNALLEQPGHSIGRYKLLQKIGEGGCGVVYMAEQQEPVRRRVALKVIKLGMDTAQVVARFEAERQALALMDHPNIARVLDAGATEIGRPFFVMELVGGVKITDYCDQHRLTTRQRLTLFIQVCRAIQHAHQKGIIHRDIKPSNVLVAFHDGVAIPKVIDFGIAKATQGRMTDDTVFTAFEQFIGTPAYMSPEQAQFGRLDVDTRSDIYSLGVLLYELLTGRTPFDTQELLAGGLEGVCRTIREKEPPTPSTRLKLAAATRQVQGAGEARIEHQKSRIPTDLDWIVMKCLEKERARRYETANGIARDLERHLNQEPVSARPPSTLYTLHKFIRRNRITAAAATAIATVLVLGIAGVGLAAARARRAEHAQSRLAREAGLAQANEARERQKAQTEAGKSRQVAQLLKDMLQGVGPSKALGRETTMLREILDQAAERAARQLTNQPEVELELVATLADVYRELGLFQSMEQMARRGLSLATNTPPAENPATALACDQLAFALLRLGKLPEAEEFARRALELRRKLFHDNHPDVARSLRTLGMVLANRGRLPEAETTLRQALEMLRNLGGETQELAAALNALGNVLLYEDKFAEAEAAQGEALMIRRNLFPSPHPAVASSLNYMGYALLNQGKTQDAEPLFREALTIWHSLGSTNHTDAALVLYNLACVQFRKCQFRDAEDLFRQTLEIRQRLLGKSPDVGYSLKDLAAALRMQDKLAEAETNALAAVAMQRNVLGNYHPSLAEALDTLGTVLHDQGKLEEAEDRHREALAIKRKTSADSLTFVAISLDALAEVLCDRAKAVDAEPLAQECLALRRKHTPGWQSLNTQVLLGRSLLGQNRFGEAEPLLLEACAGLEAYQDKIPCYEKSPLKEAIKRLVELYHLSGQPDQAAPWTQKLDALKRE